MEASQSPSWTECIRICLVVGELVMTVGAVASSCKHVLHSIADRFEKQWNSLSKIVARGSGHCESLVEWVACASWWSVLLFGIIMGLFGYGMIAFTGSLSRAEHTRPSNVGTQTTIVACRDNVNITAPTLELNNEIRANIAILDSLLPALGKAGYLFADSVAAVTAQRQMLLASACSMKYDKMPHFITSYHVQLDSAQHSSAIESDRKDVYTELTDFFEGAKHCQRHISELFGHGAAGEGIYSLLLQRLEEAKEDLRAAADGAPVHGVWVSRIAQEDLPHVEARLDWIRDSARLLSEACGDAGHCMADSAALLVAAWEECNALKTRSWGTSGSKTLTKQKQRALDQLEQQVNAWEIWVR